MSISRTIVSTLIMGGVVFALTACGKTEQPAPQAPVEEATQAPVDPAESNVAPEFELVDSKGALHKLSDYRGKYVVLEWINHGCPYVKKHYGGENMQKLQATYGAKGVIWLSICSSAPGTQGHMSAEDWNKANFEHKSVAAAVLLDEDGKVGRAYGARTTPHMYVVDPEGNLIYKGAIDDKPTTKIEDLATATNYVSAALDEALSGKPVTLAASEPYGCGVKYADEI